VLLAATLKFLRDEELGSITLQEAKTLFSPVGDGYTLGNRRGRQGESGGASLLPQ
jgi:hypothetical protein